jgi:hypothetical protein
MGSWLAAQYNDIKGNAKWALLGLVWWAMIAVGKYLLAQYTRLPSWGVWAILLAASVLAFLWLARSLRHQTGTQVAVAPSTGAAQMVASAALAPPMRSPIDVEAFFRQSYMGQLQGEVEGNVRALIQSRQPNE